MERPKAAKRLSHFSFVFPLSGRPIFYAFWSVPSLTLLGVESWGWAEAVNRFNLTIWTPKLLQGDRAGWDFENADMDFRTV